MADLWRPIPGYGGMYEISNFGEIRSWWQMGGNRKQTRANKPHIVHPYYRIRKSKKNDLQMVLWDGEKKSVPISVKNIMRDVWMQGEIPDKYVTFKDGDSKNCALHNLRYANLNEQHKGRILSQRKPVLKCTADHEVICIYKSSVEAAKKEFLSPSGIRNRIRRKAVIDGIYFKHER